MLIDVVGFAALAVSLVGMWRLGGQRRDGWAWRLVAGPLWALYAILCGRYPYIITAAIYIALDVRGWLKSKPAPMTLTEAEEREWLRNLEIRRERIRQGRFDA